MSEMVERVAWALRQTKASLSNPEADALARAAIEAMREPTKEMKLAARTYGEISELDAAHCWHEMIETTLQPCEQPQEIVARNTQIT